MDHISILNAGNRWFDKTIQVFVCRNGDNGMTYEHSPAEAVALMTVTDHALHCAYVLSILHYRVGEDTFEMYLRYRYRYTRGCIFQILRYRYQ